MVGRRLLSLSTNDAILGPRGVIPEEGRGGSVGQTKGKEEEPPDCGAYTESESRWFQEYLLKRRRK